MGDILTQNTLKHLLNTNFKIKKIQISEFNFLVGKGKEKDKTICCAFLIVYSELNIVLGIEGSIRYTMYK